MWWQTYLPERVAFTVGPLSIHWYGLLIAIGAALGIYTMTRLARRYGISSETIYDYALWMILFCLIAERLYYVLYAWPYYSEHLIEIVQVWKGGLAIHGSFIAGPLVTLWYARKAQIPVWRLLDLAVVGLAVGMAVGRWGNYFNQELFGTPTTLPWGIPITPALRPTEYADATHFHPTFLYESLWNFFVYGIMFVLHTLKLKKTVLRDGDITLAFFILYSLGRIGTEFLRTDYTPFIFGMRWAQFVSIAVALGAAGVLANRFRLRHGAH